MSAVVDVKASRAFVFVRADYADGVASLVYRFDDGPEMVERIRFPDAPSVPAMGERAFRDALGLLHLIAGVSYYKAGVPREIRVEGGALDDATAALMELVYTHGLGEFAYQNQLELEVRFPRGDTLTPSPSPAGRERGAQRASSETPLPDGERGRGEGNRAKTLVPIGGGKDSLVTVELLRQLGADITATWVGNSELIRACVDATGLPRLNIGRELSPLLFELNRNGAYNGHIPVTAINSAILVVAATLYGYDAIAFSNERSASAPTLESNGREVNHQWSKGDAFERAFASHLTDVLGLPIDYYSALRPLSELAVTRLFAKLTRYHGVFSSCNRNFKILGARPESRWCGQCPKCQFVFLALAPFMPKPQLLAIFGRNLLDDATLASGFDALLEWHAHKPFECVGEARESRAAMVALSQRAEWREDAIVARFADVIAPHIDTTSLAIAPLLEPDREHRLPERLREGFDALVRA